MYLTYPLLVGPALTTDRASVCSSTAYKKHLVLTKMSFIGAVGCSAQNTESHFSHLRIDLIAEYFPFYAFCKDNGLERD